MSAAHYKLNTSWVIYGLYSVDNPTIRYVGYTSNQLQKRFNKHLYDAVKLPIKRHVYWWINSIGLKNVRVRILEVCPIDNFEYLNYAEQYWIKSLREFNFKLTNHDKGGRGGRGRPKTKNWLEIMSLRMAGKNNPMYDVHRFGKDNPMYGRTGESAPAFGRTGDKHPMYGKVHSDETKQKMSVKASGKNNAFYGKTHTEQTKKLISEKQKGKPSNISDAGREKLSSSSKKQAHIRWHTNRNLKKDGCIYCDI